MMCFLRVSALLILALESLFAESDQLGAEVEVVTLSEGASYDEVVYAQRSEGDRLTLDANSCFFFPVGPRHSIRGKKARLDFRDL
jgi:hypothetical protein